MSASRVLRSRLVDVRDALTTIPSISVAVRCALAYLVFLVCAVPIALAGGLVHSGFGAPTAATGAIVALTLLIHPAVTEELVFRALLLPRRVRHVSTARLVVTIMAALFVYVAAHPLNAWLFWPAALPVFSSTSYLAAAALLGLTCSVVYLMSGSVWPGVVIHWVTVLAWILFLGGQALLQRPR